MKKIILHGKEARKSLKIGLDKAADAIKVTLGPSGRNVLIGRPYQYAEVTNDGVTIARDIYLDNEIEQLGAEKIKEIASATDDKAGDGTTTATVLAQAILNAGFKKLDVDNTFTNVAVDPIKIRKEIEVACEKICAELDKRAKPITSIEDIQHVAFVSVEDQKLAQMIASLFNVIGKDGVVTVEEAFTEGVESEVVEGLEIEAGFSSETLANSSDKTFTLEKPAILVTDNPINFKEEIAHITRQLSEQNVKNLIIIADNFSQEVLKAFVLAKVENVFNIIAIKTPFFGKPERLQDVAISLEAQFVSKETTPLTKVGLEVLGTCKKIIISKDKTIILKPKGKTKDRLEELNTELKKATSKFDQEQLKKRIAKLSGGIAVIRVGGESDTERVYLKKKIEDAVNATKYALQEGVVKGGGFTLMNISEKMEPNILSEAIKAPYKQIQENAGGSLEIGDDILDPVKTTKTALKNACSVASLILTTEVVIADKYEEPKDFTDE